jgi:hypothetical protein
VNVRPLTRDDAPAVAALVRGGERRGEESQTGATKLYERVGMHVESATAVFEKGLR